MDKIYSKTTEKKKIRKKYRAIRKNVNEINTLDYFYNSFFFNKNLNSFFMNKKIIASYIPIDGEVNVLPLMFNLLNLGFKIVVPSENKLKFQEWNKKNKDLVPDVIITPIVSFNNNMDRLGFGTGWYDKIIKKFRPIGKIFIGIAYEKQYCKDIPIEEHDQKLDIIITEKFIRYKDKSVLDNILKSNKLNL